MEGSGVEGSGFRVQVGEILDEQYLAIGILLDGQ
jgi:hypothetical protein